MTAAVQPRPAGVMARRYEDQVVLVTGAGSGLGAAMADRFAAEGASVVLSDIDRRGEDVAARISADHGGPATFTEVDVRDDRQVSAWVGRAREELGRIDVLVSNAGLIRDGRIEQLSDEEWTEVLDVHLGGTFRCIRSVLPHMKQAGYGRLISVASIARRGNFGQANYAAAKAGIVALARTVALEGAAHGITSNVVSPGPIDTPMLAAMKEEVRTRMCARIPVGRTGQPEEVAAAAAFLGAPEASFVTGVVVEVDGGLSVVMPLA